MGAKPTIGGGVPVLWSIKWGQNVGPMCVLAHSPHLIAGINAQLMVAINYFPL